MFATNILVKVFKMVTLKSFLSTQISVFLPTLKWNGTCLICLCVSM